MNDPILLHRPALEHNEARHSLILNALNDRSFLFHPVGEPGECAIMTRRSLILGDLTQSQCHFLADRIVPDGVIGPDDTTEWFVDFGSRHADYHEVEKHFIWSLATHPIYPGCTGHARPVEHQDLDLMLEWLPLFQQESNPHDPIPSPDEIRQAVLDASITLWIDRGGVVSMAGSTRRLKHSASITGVYTPPEHRGHGYAGAATAGMVERIFQEGRRMVALYTDLANAASNRCYEKIGFQPVCRSAYWVRG